MTTRQPTPQGISGLLNRAGFERSVSSATAVKGWRNYSEGFGCRKSYSLDGGVLAQHLRGPRCGILAAANPDAEADR